MFTKMPEAGLTDEQFERVTVLLDLLGPEMLPDNPMVCDTIIRTLIKWEDEKGLDWIKKNIVPIRNDLEQALSIFG